ncbi:Rep [uncultured virus]|uniref:Rep n=1 Tax=uncultured virus TaxID=340016 RepID=A0A2K9LS13_9VIRU|nr:Rep [uncultured virus]
MSENTRATRWLFTLNNYTPQDLDYDVWLYLPQNDISYLVVGRETAPTTGTPHLQGYIRFGHRKRLTQVVALIPRAHWTAANGSEEQNRTYCSKGAGVVERGTYDPRAGVQGRRSDLDNVAALAVAGSTALQIAEAHPSDYIRYHSGIDRLISLSRFRNSTIHRQVSIMVLYGATRIGKTYFVYHQVAPSLTTGLYKTPSPSLRGGYSPFDMYNGEEGLFIDEFDFHNWPITLLNEILEGYPQQLQCRYNNKYALWTSVVICTNIHPDTWYLDQPSALIDALKARLRGCVHEITDRAQLASVATLPAPMW